MEFSKLEEFLENKFIDKYLKCKKRINEETDEEFYEQYIRLCDIEKLKLSDEELDFVFKYLEKEGINVHGTYQCYNGVYNNYKQIASTYYYKYSEYIEDDNSEMLKEYQKTKDKELKNRIIRSNMRLVEFLVNKYCSFFKIDRNILESYGYEGLIMSIDKIDLSKGKMSATMSSYIKSYIFRGAILETLGQGGPGFLENLYKKNNDFRYLEYFYILNGIEKEKGESVKDNPDILDLVFECLARFYNERDLTTLKNRIFSKNTYSIEQLGDDLLYFDDDLLCNEIIEKIFQDELKDLNNKFMDKLTPKEEYTINNYTKTNKKLCEVAKDCGVSHEAIRLREKKALKKIKKQMVSYKNKERVNSFLDNMYHEYSENHIAYINKRRNS